MNIKLISAFLLAAALVAPAAGGKGPPDRPVLLNDAQGGRIGRVIGMETSGWPYVLTDQGYRTLFRLAWGRVYLSSPVFFETTDCSETAYVLSGRYLGTVFLPTSDDALAYATGSLLYSPSDTTPVLIDINSTLDDSLGCQPAVGPATQAYPAFPNDPVITGISNTAYPARLLIE